jgi:23S rRNA pseudouridine1911/1915/1917 synthase
MMSDTPLEVLYEDDALLVVCKPAGIVVHPTYKHLEGTLMDAVWHHARDWGGGRRPSIVGRLDKLTSGLVVVAKSREIHAALQRELTSARSSKEYLAVVAGEVDEEQGRIEVRLHRDPGDRRRVVASTDAGRASVTLFERVFKNHGFALLRCRILTGRMHQIRVHLASRGWPIVGDPVYGTPDPDFPRLALHAWRVSFVLPSTGRRYEIEAPVPDDLRARIELMHAYQP